MNHRGAVNPSSDAADCLTSRRCLCDFPDWLPLFRICMVLVNAVWPNDSMPPVPKVPCEYKMKKVSIVISMSPLNEALAYPYASDKMPLLFYEHRYSGTPSSTPKTSHHWTNSITNVWCTLKISAQWWKTWFIPQVSLFIPHIQSRAYVSLIKAYFTCWSVKMSDPYIINSHTNHSTIQLSDSLQQKCPLHLQKIGSALLAAGMPFLLGNDVDKNAFQRSRSCKFHYPVRDPHKAFLTPL